MHQLFVLYEDATGYALFRTTEFEEIASFVPQVQDSILDVSKFRSVVFLVAFQRFETWRESLENIKSVSESLLHKTLQLFLENNVPRSKKSKQGIMLGVQDPELASVIKDKMDINCSSSGAVMEIIRGIRIHFRKLLKSFHDEKTIIGSKLAMGHHYSRAKVNQTINKADKMITQGLMVVDQLNRDTNLLSVRLRKLYDCHFPELFKIVPNPLKYVLCVKEIQNRKTMSKDISQRLMDVLNDESLVENIIISSKRSMGLEVCEEDIENVVNFADHILSLVEQQKTQTEYVKTKMHVIAPSLGNLMGEMGGARLISDAGSLTHLSKLPASTVQILGAKKSLFRSLKSKDAPLKFASINKASCIGQDNRITKGKMSRFLANKCSLAARSDCFSVVPSGDHGSKLKLEVEARMEFYKRGKADKVSKKRKRKSMKKKSKNLKRNLDVTTMEVER